MDEVINIVVWFLSHIKQVDSMLSCVCSVTYHRRHNVVRTSKTLSAIVCFSIPHHPLPQIFHKLLFLNALWRSAYFQEHFITLAKIDLFLFFALIKNTTTK